MRKIVALVAFSLIITVGMAQTNKVRAGFAFSNGLSFMKSDNTNVTDTKVGYAFDYGVPLDIQFNENYALGTGLIISHLRAGRSNSPALDTLRALDIQNGTTFIVDNNIVAGADESYRFTYVNFPVTFKLKTNAVGYFKFFGEFGLNNGIRVRSRLTIKGSNYTNESIVKKNDLGIQSKFFDASLKVGGGFEYTISDKTALLVALNFQNGFMNILNDGEDGKRTVLRYISIRSGILF